MSASKVIWSSPEINRRRRLFNATKLNDISIRSLKCQVTLFLAIITEMCFNLLLRLLKGFNPSISTYVLICKTFLTINIVFIASYTYQIIQARIIIYLEIRENKTEPILKSLIFEMLPQLKYYYEKLMKWERLSKWLQKDFIEQERITAKLDEERRKILRKMYLPSLYLPRDSSEHMAMKRELYPSRESMYLDYPGMALTVYDGIKPMTSSTPFLHRRSATQSPCYEASSSQPLLVHDDRASFGPDMRGDIRSHSLDGTFITRYQPSSPSSSRTNSYSPLSVFASYRNQSGVLSEVPTPDVWPRIGIDSNNLDKWILNLRQWIHGTVMARVVQEIDKINQRFDQLAISDVVIGEANVQTLRHLANQPGKHFPSLPVLINFLDCSKDQGYVVNRIRELSQGCSLGKFQWDSGSTSTRHPWKEHLPNDSVLVLHLLSTYIDSRVHSSFHGIRTFSQQFIIDNFDNKDPGDLKDICLLLQCSVQPPHFKVIFDQTIFAVAAGRRNLFECLIVFFFKVYKNEGNLKWLNLGRSGLNLNWIFDESS